MSAAQIKMWHRCFKDDWASVESDPRSVQPATSRTPENIERVQPVISKDHWLTGRTRSWSGNSKTTVSEILMQDLGMKRAVAKFVLQLLLLEQKEHHAAVANDLIQTATNEPDFLKKVITGWIVELREVPRCLRWRGLRCHCPMYNVSRIFFNICLYFSYYMAGYLLNTVDPTASYCSQYFSICKLIGMSDKVIISKYFFLK